MVRIPLEPDDVVALLLGTAPLLDGEASVDWDPGAGHELLVLKRGDLVERVVLDGTEQRWDVLEASLQSAGKSVWTLKHKDFHDVKTQDGQTVRLPGASLFEQGGDTVKILWRDQRVGAPLDDAESFHVAVPPGLPACP
jgi:hypothetical protein